MRNISNRTTTPHQYTVSEIGKVTKQATINNSHIRKHS